jgi:hypothetical protein
MADTTLEEIKKQVDDLIARVEKIENFLKHQDRKAAQPGRIRGREYDRPDWLDR